ALIAKPRFLLMDEPFSSLDVPLRAKARVLLKEILAQVRVPTLLVSHDPEDEKTLADFVVKIENGKVTDSLLSRDVVQK
ncbi:MAG: hypothetical protein KDD22_03375, partial [Bdellovibrionales bacterium]|nr:hypothetical protein [Bdellovibrionales bacterium]